MQPLSPNPSPVTVAETLVADTHAEVEILRSNPRATGYELGDSRPTDGVTVIVRLAFHRCRGNPRTELRPGALRGGPAGSQGHQWFLALGLQLLLSQQDLLQVTIPSWLSPD